jgi:hypothetical protein
MWGASREARLLTSEKGKMKEQLGTAIQLDTDCRE